MSRTAHQTPPHVLQPVARLSPGCPCGVTEAATTWLTEQFGVCDGCGRARTRVAAGGHGVDPHDTALPLGPGTIFRDRYRLIDLLGRGQHGLTFLAQHEYLDHPCLVKVLPYQIHDAADAAVVRLRNEAAAGFLVNHPNVVRVLDCDEYRGMWYLVTEFVAGADLKPLARTHRRLPPAQVIEFLLDAAAGLEAIHAAGLIHRDLKPGNLLLGVDGHVRVADLGVVGFMHHHAQRRRDQEPERVGTLAYAAPEVLSGAAPTSPAADLFSLGATLFELLVGRPPHGRSALRVLLDRVDAPIRWPADGPADTPAWLVATVERLVALQPKDRFGSAQELVEHVSRCSGRSSSPVAVPAGALEPGGVAVLHFTNAGETPEDDWLGHALADHFSQMWSRVPGVYVADRELFQQTLERVRARASPGADAALLEASRLAGVLKVVHGSFRRVGDCVSVWASLHDQRAVAPVSLDPVSGPLADLARLEQQLFAQMVGASGMPGVEPLAGQAATLRAPLAAEERYVAGKRAYLRGDYDGAVEHATAAIELDAAHGEALGLAAVCYARMGRYEQALQFNTRQRALARQSADARLEIEADSNLGVMHYFRGDYERATENLERAMHAAESLGLTSDAALIRNNLGHALLNQQRATEAEAMFRGAIEVHQAYGALVSLIGPYNGLGHVLREQGRIDDARGQFRKALMLAFESDDFVNIGIAYNNLGYCALLSGRFDEAKHELATALNVLEQTRFWNGLARVYEHMCELNLRLGNWVEADRCATLRIELAKRHSNHRMELAAWRQKASALERGGRDEQLQECRREMERLEQSKDSKAGAV